MSEVICPFCGTSNSPEADLCKSCKKSLYEQPPAGFDAFNGEQPDWLNNFREASSEGDDWEETENNQEQVNRSEKSPEEDVPEWLERIRQRSIEDQQSEESKDQPEESFDAPLKDWHGTFTPSEEADSKSASPPPANAIPDWMAEFREEQQSEQANISSEPEVNSVPDWLKLIREKEEEDLPKSEEVQTSEEFTLDLQDEGGVTKPSENGEIPEEIPPKELTEKRAISSENVESWLEELVPDEPKDDLDFSQLPIPPAFRVETESVDREDNKLQEDESQIKPSQEHSDRPKDRSAPQTSSKPSRKIPDKEFSKSDQEAEIEPAQLPGWLEAMKPIESVAPIRFAAEADQQIEKSGPLAGFKGIIPGGNLISPHSRPPLHSVKLEISEKQHVYANLLENLIAEEAKPTLKQVEPIIAPLKILRLFVGIVLVGLLGFMLVSGVQIGTLPGLYAPETVAFFNTIQQFSQTEVSATRLLVAVEYEPGLTGEMQTIAQYPIQQLLESGSQLVLVSTLPTGPALGTQLVARSSENQPNPQTDLHVINLGYLVGGTTSLANLAAQPSTAAILTEDGQPAWDLPILQGIQAISDFDGILLITDNPETGRAWIEQVQPALDGKPFLVVSSAQSAPMLLPYYQSKQIQGMLAGLTGSAAYDQLTQRGFSPARSYWDTYQAGVLLVILAILIGALIYGIQSVFRSQQTGKRN